jgi:two-component system response regulator GlrR
MTSFILPSAQLYRSAAHSTKIAAATTRKPKPTVLLVDDDSSVRNGISRVLVAEGLRVVAARGVKDALEHIARNTPDLVITDLCMAPLSGWDLIVHLESHFPALPIFVVTALPPVKSAGGVSHGADAFFQKPLNLDVLLAAIGNQLGLSGTKQSSAGD